MLQNIKILIIFSIMAISLLACECVPGLDTAKEIKPDQSAELAFMNCTSDASPLSLSSNSLDIALNTENSLDFAEYKKTYSGDNFLQILFEKNILFNGLVSLKKDSRNTLIAYGSSQRARILSIEDSIKSQSVGNSLLRVINLAVPAKTLQARIGKTEPMELKFKSFSPIKSFTAGYVSLEIIDPENNNQIIIKNVLTESGKITNFIVIGDEINGGYALRIIKNNL